MPTDADARVTTATLRDARALGDGPTIVHLDAVDLNIGAVDPSAELVPIAR